jgi:magnesium-protoporphyrin IX monomethyl ester (oxidative) cyclase
MKVLLLHLPLTRRSYSSHFTLSEPLAEVFLAPALAGRHELRLVDLRVTPDLERELGDFAPDAAAVGVGPLTIGAADRTLTALRARFPRIRILLFADAEYGNSHVAERPHDFAHELADALVRPTFLAPVQRVAVDVFAAWEDGADLMQVPGLLVQVAPGDWRPTRVVENRFADIGAPDRKLLGRARARYRFAGVGRLAHVFYTYGCRFKCRFCPMSKHDGSIATRALDDVMHEIEELTEPNVYLQDFEPFLAPEAMHALADRVERAGVRKRWFMMTRADTALAQGELIARWKRLGLRWLYLGLDGHTSERLKDLRKGNSPQINERAVRAMRALGLGVFVGFVVRPEATRDELRSLADYARSLGAPIYGFTVETPLVGTQLLDERERLLTTRDWSLFDLQHAVLPTSLPLDDFYRELGGMHFEAGLRSLPAMLRHFPLLDFARNSLVGWRALADVRRSARDHGRDVELASVLRAG